MRTLFLTSLFLASCGGDKNDPDSAADTDLAADTDTDTDTDADADADTDTDTDTDTDADILRVTGVDEGGKLGAVVAATGDMDGDNTPDLLVASVELPSAVWLFDGTLRGDVGPADATATITAGFNWLSADALGDFNGDAVGDVVVGESNPGGAYIFFGPVAGPLTLADADVAFTGAFSIGNWVFGVGDLNADGFDDLATALYGGEVYLVHGPGQAAIDIADADTLITGLSPQSTPVDVSSVDDGDGLQDIVLTVHTVQEPIHLFRSPIGANVTLADADATIELGTDPGYKNGVAMIGNLDLEGDGTADLLIASPDNRRDDGRVFGFPANIVGIQNMELAPVIFEQRITSGSNMGGALAGLGDIDGDGFDDLAIGSDLSDNVIMVFNGPLTGRLGDDQATWLLYGPNSNSSYGADLATLGDIDGDAVVDLLIGADRTDAALPDVGAAHVLSLGML